MKKNTVMIMIKYIFCQNESTFVEQDGSPEAPELLWYSVIAKIGAVNPNASSQHIRQVNIACVSVHGSALDLNGRQIA